MPKTIELSATSIECFMSCRRQYWFRYIQKLRPLRRETPLTMGSAVHSGQEYLFKCCVDSPIDRDALRETVLGEYSADELALAGTDPLVAIEMVMAWDKAVEWREKWKFLEVEPKLRVPAGTGRRLIVRFDGVVQDRKTKTKYILEHKTIKGRVDDRRLNHLLWDTQASVYVLAARETGHDVAGIIYNFMPKPTFTKALATPSDKRKYKKDGTLYSNMREDDETDEEYMQRVRDWYTENMFDPTFFRQHIVMRNKNQVEMMVNQVKMIASDIRACERAGTFYMNPAACKILSCPYQQVCLEDTPEVRDANYRVNTGGRGT